MSLPAGDVTFLMTDVEGSTRLWEQHADVMTGVLSRHDAIVASAVEGAGGTLLRDRSEGDSSFAVFLDASDALAAALELQRGLAAATWPLDLTIRARAAVHSGRAAPRSGSYYGPSVNRVVRLRAIGHGAQTLVSGATAASAGRLPPQASLRDLGLHRLKDLVRPEQVFELLHPDLARDHPPLRSLDVERHNLPEQAGALVGRETDVEHVVKMVGDDRVVELLGPGGVGKTRLAVDAAKAALPSFPGGTWFVDLSRVQPGGEVVDSVAAVVGVREQPGRPLVETVADAIGDATVLLVLDNCEHVTAAVRTVASTLLRRCPSMRLLATSRERLGVPGERVWRVGPLDLDDAVRLFGSRSGGGPSEAAREICRRVEGIPLAVEMAARQAATMGEAAVVDSLAASLGDLGTGEATLRATIGWSHRLLDAAEQTLFRRLAVFRGPFDLDAVEGVCPDDSSLAEDEVLDLLGALVDSSLLVLGNGGGYRVLEPVREFAEEQLEASGERTAVGGRHLAWYRRVAEECQQILEAADPTPALDRLELEHDNLLAAMGWDDEVADRDAQMALANDLWRFWDLSARWSEGRSQVEARLERGTAYRTYRSTAHFHAGALAERQCDLDAARAHQERSLEILESVARDLEAAGSEQLPAILLHVEAARTRLAELARLHGAPDEAAALAARAVEALRALGADRFLPPPLQCLAYVALGRGALSEAGALLEQALELARANGLGTMQAQLLNDLGVTARAAGRVEEAEARYRESLATRTAIRDRAGVTETRYNLAELALHRGTLGEREVEDLLLEFQEASNARGVADAELLLGDLTVAADGARASRHYERARALRQGLGLRAPALEATLRLAPLVGAPDHGTLVREAAALGEPAHLVEALVTAARCAPGDPRAAGWLSRAADTARDCGAAIEAARVAETAAVLLGDPGLLAAVAERRRRLGVVAAPRDLRWRAGAGGPAALTEATRRTLRSVVQRVV